MWKDKKRFNKEFEKEPLLPEDFSFPAQGKLVSKLSAFYEKSFAVIKLILGLGFLPFVYSVSISFVNELKTIDKVSQGYLWIGAITFIIMYLFIYEAAIFYRKGQKIVEVLFKFFAPLVRVAPYLLPIYTILLFFLYSAIAAFVKSNEVINNFLFLFGFSMMLHLVFSAKSLRSKQKDFLKGSYIFGFSFVYITNAVILALFLNFIFEKFSVVNFLNNSFHTAQGILNAIILQLFKV